MIMVIYFLYYKKVTNLHDSQHPPKAHDTNFQTITTVIFQLTGKWISSSYLF